MKILAVLFTIFILTACKSNSADELNLSQADSVVIRFIAIAYSDSTLKQVITTDKAAIKTIVNYINGSAAQEDAKCGFSGELQFYKNQQRQKNISFNYTKDGCAEFVWQQGEKWITTKMTNEAADFFQALEKGQTSF